MPKGALGGHSGGFDSGSNRSIIVDMRSRALMLGIELVRNRTTKVLEANRQIFSII